MLLEKQCLKPYIRTKDELSSVAFRHVERALVASVKGRSSLSTSYEQERWYRDQLERAKEKIHSHKDFPDEFRWELDALES